MDVLQTDIEIRPSVDSTKVLTHVMAEEHGVLITRHTEDGAAVIKRWNMSRMLPGIAERDTPGYRQNLAVVASEPVINVSREQGDTVIEGESYPYDLFVFFIHGYSPMGIPRDYLSGGNTYPTYHFWPDGESEVPLVPDQDDYVWQDNLTYIEKQQYAIKAMDSVWRPQKRAWLRELAEYVDVNPAIPEHGGYWLRAADRALQIEFQDGDVDPLIVAAKAMEASKGAADIDSVEDFVNGLNGIISQFPTGPPSPRIWVSADANGVVTRLNLLDSVEYTQGLGADYNPISSDWIVENQQGQINLTITPNPINQSVSVGATLADPDMPSTETPLDDPLWSAIVWHLESYSDVNETWSSVTGGLVQPFITSITIQHQDSGEMRYRVTASYTDQTGPGQTAISEEFSVG